MVMKLIGFRFIVVIQKCVQYSDFKPDVFLYMGKNRLAYKKCEDLPDISLKVLTLDLYTICLNFKII